MFDFRRTHTCGSLTKEHAELPVTLSGWVHRRRDHGGLIFIDLRDRFGITQLVFKPSIDAALHEKATQLRSEWVISIKGKVLLRTPAMVNPNLKTGAIEIEVHAFEILSKANPLPFSIADDHIEVNEEKRLKYRYLDMRRGKILENLVLRHKVMQSARHFLSDEGFIEVATPILGKSTPEGARDYLVPSRIYPGMFYALPQSPQLFKQLLMIGGLDRYFQIAPCFRDEALRADRQPEFTQIDIEMSFCKEEDLFPIIEKMVQSIFKEAKGIELFLPFRRLTYKEAMESYGCDKPDLRFGMPLVRITDLIAKSSLSVFHDILDMKGIAKAFCIKDGADIPRKTIEEYLPFVEQFGLTGLTWIKLGKEGISSPILKYLPETVLHELVQKCEAKTNDLLLIAAGQEKCVNQGLDHLRRHIAKKRNLIPGNRFEFAWVTDFPLFQWDEETQRYECEHHPFTSPHVEDIPLLDIEPLNVRSSSYDLVLNGYELCSGSVRIFDTDLQHKIFTLLELSQEEIQGRFGFFLEALYYGTPPHLGIALGLDRLIMILGETDNIRDVIAFPKTQKGADLMLSAPSDVLKEQLSELKIHVEESP